MHGGAFLERRAAKQLLARLRARASHAAAGAVKEEALRAGFMPDPPEGTGPVELARQADLARFVSLSADFTGDVAAFLAMIEERFGGERDRDAVQLMTLHMAKGLEFDAVSLPRLEERELPYWRATTPAMIDEERRLFYVGITRAKRILELSWTRKGKRSSFVETVAPFPPKNSSASGSTGSRYTRRRRAGLQQSTRTGTRQSPPPDSGGLAAESWLPDWMRNRKRED